MRVQRGGHLHRGWKTGLGFVAALAVLAGIGGGPATVEGQDRAAGDSATSYRMPSVSLARYIQSGADSVDAWQRRHREDATDRVRLYHAVRDLLRMHDRFETRVAETYPRGQVEWLLITDAVADTLAEALTPLLTEYRESHPQEILTEGRQLVELEMASIMGPPSRMLGLHVVLLADRIAAAIDTLQAEGATADAAGLQEGLLRYADDWTQLYSQVHGDPIAVYESRVNQEDWIIARLEDRCGNKGGGTWALKEQWMSLVEWDTTVTPHVEKFAHEYHLVAQDCPGDTRVIYIDLPNFHEVQAEVQRLHLEGKIQWPTPQPQR